MAKDKKKLKSGESYTIDNRPDGMSKREWIAGRTSEGRDPYAKFFSDPVADRKAQALSTAKKAQADAFIAEKTQQPQQTQPLFQPQNSAINGIQQNNIFQPQQSQLSDQDKQVADQFLADNFQGTQAPLVQGMQNNLQTGNYTKEPTFFQKIGGYLGDTIRNKQQKMLDQQNKFTGQLFTTRRVRIWVAMRSVHQLRLRKS